MPESLEQLLADLGGWLRQQPEEEGRLSDELLLAYVARDLPPQTRREVQGWLARHPAALRRVNEARLALLESSLNPAEPMTAERFAQFKQNWAERRTTVLPKEDGVPEPEEADLIARVRGPPPGSRGRGDQCLHPATGSQPLPLVPAAHEGGTAGFRRAAVVSPT